MPPLFRFMLVFLIFFLIACAKENELIKIKGSDTEVNLAVDLAESFHATNSTVFVSVSGGGSGLGIASLLNGNADIANSSRAINASEITLFQQKQIEIDSFVFAEDAVAFVVSTKLPIDSIGVRDLGKILSGNEKNWAAVNAGNLRVNIYGRQSNSGTHDFVKKKLGIEFTPYAKQMNGNAQILEAIRADGSGIGYVGAGYVHGNTRGIKVLTISGNAGEKAISPLDGEMIKKGAYFFQRPLFQYYKKDSYNKIKPFLAFEKSMSGKNIIQSVGYYSLQ